jgi:hypothetical protein
MSDWTCGLDGVKVGDVLVIHYGYMLRRLAEVTAVTPMHFKATATEDDKFRIATGYRAGKRTMWDTQRYAFPRLGEVEEIKREVRVIKARHAIEDALPKCNDPDALEAAFAAICGMAPTPEGDK